MPRETNKKPENLEKSAASQTTTYASCSPHVQFPKSRPNLPPPPTHKFTWRQSIFPAESNNGVKKRLRYPSSALIKLSQQHYGIKCVPAPDVSSQFTATNDIFCGLLHTPGHNSSINTNAEQQEKSQGCNRAAYPDASSSFSSCRSVPPEFSSPLITF